MKHSAVQFTRQRLQEAKQHQESDSNVAEYLILIAQSEENGYFSYLNEEEIEEFENDSTRREELVNEIESFINEHFDFNFKEFEY